MKLRPEILVYRRTHTGDPGPEGIFGCNGCMGSVRSWSFDAVIGIGGSNPWPEDRGISKKITWIGIDAHRYPENSENPLVSFSKFKLLDSNGPSVFEVAPKLYEYMFELGHIPRTGKNFPDSVYKELLDILKLADKAPPSVGRPVPIHKKSASCTNKREGC